MENNKPSVQILMSTYNGEKYIDIQMDSIFKQKGVDVNILIRDDGSTDGTVSKLEEYQTKYPVKIVKGQNLGYANSFWELVQLADGADYYAFSDQDDYWMNDKVITAVRMIKETGDFPILYTSNVDTVDADMKLINHNAFPVSGTQNFKQSLLTSILPGCTFIFNHKLLLELKKYNRLVISHDCLVYIIAAAVGGVIYDDNPHIKYRIHDNNTLGIPSPFKRLKAQIHNFIRPKFPNGRSVIAKNIYDIYKYDMKKEDREVSRLFGYYKMNYVYIWKLLKEREFRKLILDILLILGKA